MASGTAPSGGPRFPSSVLLSWLGFFSASVALATVWVTHMPLLLQVALTALFALVPLGILIFWLGRFFQDREHRRRG